MRLSVACNLIPKGVRMRTGRWIISHRCGWNGLCILCNARIFIHSVYSSDHRTRALSVNCPSVICLPSMCYLYGETPLVNCGSWSYFLISLQSSTAALFTFLQFTFLQTIHHPHNSFNPLCSAKPVSLTTSLNSWGKVIWLFVCRFQVAADAGSAPCH